MSKVRKHGTMLESQNSIVLKHEQMLRQMVKENTFQTRLETFKSEMMHRLEDRIGDFSGEVLNMLKGKVDISSFNQKLALKATQEQITKLNEKVDEVQEKIDLLNTYIEDKRKEEEENRNPLQIEIDRLDNDKADQLEFTDLKLKVEEIKEIVDSFDDDGSDDEFDDEDSVEEDVLSLAKSNDPDGEGEDDNSQNSETAEKPVEQASQPQSSTKEVKNDTMSSTQKISQFKQAKKEDKDFFNPEDSDEQSEPLIKPIKIDQNSTKPETVKKDESQNQPAIKPVKIIQNTHDPEPKKEPSSPEVKVDTPKQQIVKNEDKNDSKINPSIISPANNIPDKPVMQNTSINEAIRPTVKESENELSESKAEQVKNTLSPSNRESTFVGNISQNNVLNQSSMNMSRMNRQATISSRQSKRLSRMNSKMSIVSSKKKGPGAGLKTKIDDISKQVQEMKLNLDRNLEDVRVLKNTEYERKKLVDEMK